MNTAGKSTILIVDDEAQIRRMLALLLESAGYGVREADAGRVALGDVALHEPDLVILDPELPDTAGEDVLRALRLLCSAPILILSVSQHEDTKVAALDAGADDYMTKPFSDGELLARVRALLRRARPAAAEAGFSFGPIEVDFDDRRVLRHGRPVKLTATEFAMLRLMICNRDKVLTHRQMLRELWGAEAVTYTNYLRIYMMRLRRKLGDEVVAAGYFQTESGVGYRFVSDPPPAEARS